MDWAQLWEITTLPDNIPIVLMLLLVPFYTWYGLKQAFANDRLIKQLEADPELAKTHHRKTLPFKSGWDKLVHVWPYLLRIEFLAAVVVTVILLVWSICLDAPLEEPANPNLTMNPSKAPWYFLGLQEMLVYFDPWIAGVVLPTIIIIGLIAIPYIDINPLGSGYYTFRQRKFAMLMFLFGFHILWLVLIVIGVFLRGPGWMWFWPGMTWDHHRQVDEAFVHLPQLFGLSNPFISAVFGVAVLVGYCVVLGGLVHVTVRKIMPKSYAKMNIWQYGTLQSLVITMMALPIKFVIWHGFRIKYILITPWFNI